MSAAVMPSVWAGQMLQRKPWNFHHDEEPAAAIEPELAFYRKYTQGMLRRYMRLSMEAGRVPSLIGQEMFRGKVTSYRVRSFEDVVIFVYDVEKCLKKLDAPAQELIARIGLQEYTQGETAELLGVSLRTVVRHYADALDKLTGIFLEAKMLEPNKDCGGETCQVLKKGVQSERG
jgi:predicted DNA-binding protein (UPF0251 family)